MNKDFYSEQLSRLEKVFGRCPAPDEYFNTLHNFRPEDFIKAIDNVIQTHRPYTSHVFPSPSAILDALNDVVKNQTWPTPEDFVSAEFCERCENRGMYLDKGQAKFCDCIKGRRARAVFRYWPNRKKIVEEQAKIKSGAPPHRGLKERNPLGFWELTEAEHLKWMAAKREELTKLNKRTNEREARMAAGRKIIESESVKGIAREIIQQVEETRPLRGAIKQEIIERKPGEDDEVPF